MAQHISKMGLIDRAKYEINSDNWTRIKTTKTLFPPDSEAADWLLSDENVGWFFITALSAHTDYGYTDDIVIAFSDPRTAFDFRFRFT
ncbi:MAG: hypothetical protein EOP83_09160 [Verrucomicrobiaceae bacterium]|nr:MAG: hypothetical protein EOP83_09160 [Verrucomicrobiaceae bacterium]